MLKAKYVTQAVVVGSLLIAPACASNSSDKGQDVENSASASSAGAGAGDRASGGKGGATKPVGNGRGGESTNVFGDGGASGSGGEGGDASQCPGCASGYCLDDGSCVDCLPKNDHCPTGQFCSDEYKCAPGCKNDTTSCASGVCGANHDCARCVDDRECAGGRICSGGECTAACGAAEEGTSTGCRSDMICCSERCSNLLVDSGNCGACGNACATGQFCGRTVCDAESPAGASCVICHDTTLASLCSVAKVTVILDTSKNASDGNRVPGRAIGAMLSDTCLPKPVLTEAEQDSVDALNITTGRPVSDSSELLVVAGGAFYQNLEGYLETEKIAPLYLSYDGVATRFRRSATDADVATLPVDGDHDSHDIFIIQFMRHPVSGSLILNVQGFWLSGTVAGTYQLSHGLLPELTKQDQAWYAYEWTDLNGNKAPELDEIKLLDSGR